MSWLKKLFGRSVLSQKASAPEKNAHCKSGSIVITGPEGHGKTTLLRAIRRWQSDATEFQPQVECQERELSRLEPSQPAILIVDAYSDFGSSVKQLGEARAELLAVILNKVDLVSDPDLLDLFEMELRARLAASGYDDDNLPFLRISALKCLTDAASCEAWVLLRPVLADQPHADRERTNAPPANENNSSVSSDPAFRKYLIAKWNIEFDVPVDWDIAWEDRPSPPHYNVFGMRGPGECAPSIIMTAQMLQDTNQGVDAYISSAHSKLRQMFRQFKLVSIMSPTYCGVPCAILEYTYQGDDGIIQEMNMTAFFGEATQLALQFICETSKQTVKRDRVVQEKIIHSIRIGKHGICVPFLKHSGSKSCVCAECGCKTEEPVAVFSGREPFKWICERCFRA